MKQRGFILIARGLLKHPRFKPSGPFTALEAWHWMLEEAAFKSRTVPVKNGTRHETLQLEAGQLSHSIRYLAKAWTWSDKRVQRFLRDLILDGTITTHGGTSATTQTTTLQTVITLCNWDKYQNPFAETTTQATTQATTQTTTKKKELQRKINNTRSRAAAGNEDFAEWYATYPRKTQPDAALRAYSKIIAGGKITHAELMARTALFANEWAARIAKDPDAKQYIPYPASWLNKGGYQDVSGGPPKPSGPAPVKPATDFDDAEWRSCLSFRKRKNGQWSETDWGPPPGAPGCLVPSHLL